MYFFRDIVEGAHQYARQSAHEAGRRASFPWQRKERQALFRREHGIAMIRVTRETHDPPVSLCERLREAGGTNRLGEPNFRVVWGGSRLGWIGGKWVDRDANGNVIREAIELRQVPKYTPMDRWHIEYWMAPEDYGSPEEWYARTMEVEDGLRVPALGPYPSRGEYEHCFTLTGANSEFIPLTVTACDWVIRAVQWARRQPKAAGRAAINTREARREKEWNQRADEILDGVM